VQANHAPTLKAQDDRKEALNVVGAAAEFPSWKFALMSAWNCTSSTDGLRRRTGPKGGGPPDIPVLVGDARSKGARAA
jgi:hypothetical protein